MRAEWRAKLTDLLEKFENVLQKIRKCRPDYRDRAQERLRQSRSGRDYYDTILCEGGEVSSPQWVFLYLGLISPSQFSHIFVPTQQLYNCPLSLFMCFVIFRSGIAREKARESVRESPGRGRPLLRERGRCESPRIFDSNL